MRFTCWSSSVLLSALLLVACGDDDAPPMLDGGPPPPDAGPAYPAECENISPVECVLPWPSSRYLVDDPGTATGRRVAIPREAMPAANNGIRVDPALFTRFDGFSPATSIMTAFPGDLDVSSLADERHIEDSLGAASPTVIIDAETNERVAHFAEVDTWPYIDANLRPFYIRPAARLQEGHRYIVAIRGLRLRDGSAIEPSDYFRALRDETPLPDASDIEGRRAHFDDIFEHLAAAGVTRGEVIQAWDFETASGEAIWGDLVTMRDEALRQVEAEGARCTVERADDAPNDVLWRRVYGTVRVPLFLGGVAAGAVDESRIRRAADGTPQQNGWAEVPFIASIPLSLRDRVAAGGEPGRLLDYGHGLFGSRGESESGWFQRTISELEMVSVAIDWWGMSGEDVGRVALTLRELSTFDATAERLGQGLVNHVVLVRSFRGACADLPELQIPLDGGGTARAIDTTQSYYYGNSQGGIMGLALAGIGVDVQRYVLGVGGMTYSIMIPRSSNWVSYGAIMQGGYRNPLVRSLLMTMIQSQWDLGEPSTFASHTLRDPLPCADDVCGEGNDTPLKHLLFQIGRDDAQVANITADIAARTAFAGVESGVGYLTPAPYAPWGIPAITTTMGEDTGVSSALVIYDIPEVPMLPLGTRDPGGDNPAHEGVRRSAAAIEQIDLFLRPDGTIVQTCDGMCDPS